METPVKHINTCTALIPSTENNRLPSGPAIHLYITSKQLEFVDCCTPRQTSYAQINVFSCDLTGIYTIIKVHVLNETPGQAERVKRYRWRPWKAKLLKIWPAQVIQCNGSWSYRTGNPQKHQPNWWTGWDRSHAGESLPIWAHWVVR